MADDRWWWLLLPQSVRQLPADLAAVFGLTIVTILAVLLPGIRDTPLRIILGLPFVLFLPGYAFIAALFPEAGTSPSNTSGEDDEGVARIRDRGIDGIERVALSFGLSIAIVPLIGLVLNFTPWGIRLLPILLSVSGFTLVAAGVAARRRWDLPAEERFWVPYRDWLAAGKTELLEPDTQADAVLNVLLALSIVLAVGSVTYAVAVPKQGETFTEFYLLTEQESGELVAADYPTEFTTGNSKPLVIGVTNQEHEPVNYTIVVEQQRVRFESKNNSTTVRVLEEGELRRFQLRLPHNETWQKRYRVSPTMVGDNLRLTFLLYKGSPPPEPTVDNAYRELHLWINVTRS